MSIKKLLLTFLFCFILFFSALTSAGIFKTVVKGFIVKECIEIILKNYGKKAAQQLVNSYKDKLFNYVRNNPNLRNKVFQEIDNVSKKLLSKEKDSINYASLKDNTQLLKKEINDIVPQVVPKGVKLPKNGVWSAEKGDSRFFPSKTSKNSEKSIKEIYDMNGRTGIKYDKGNPNFSNVRIQRIRLKNLNGTPKDFDIAYKEIVNNKIEINGRHFNNTKEVKNYFKDNRLTLHHEADGQTLSIINRDLHETYRHTGGASKLRGQ